MTVMRGEVLGQRLVHAVLGTFRRRTRMQAVYPGYTVVTRMFAAACVSFTATLLHARTQPPQATIAAAAATTTPCIYVSHPQRTPHTCPHSSPYPRFPPPSPGATYAHVCTHRVVGTPSLASKEGVVLDDARRMSPPGAWPPMTCSSNRCALVSC